MQWEHEDFVEAELTPVKAWLLSQHWPSQGQKCTLAIWDAICNLWTRVLVLALTLKPHNTIIQKIKTIWVSLCSSLPRERSGKTPLCITNREDKAYRVPLSISELYLNYYRQQVAFNLWTVGNFEEELLFLSIKKGSGVRSGDCVQYSSPGGQCKHMTNDHFTCHLSTWLA